MSTEEARDNYFLSYSRDDEEFALRFAKDLRERGVAMWVDQFDIRPSEHWDRAIERAVTNCRGLVVILSPRSVASDNVADEISFAIDNGKSVLPVMIERCPLPLRLTRMQLVNAVDDYERALEKCLEELQGGDRPSKASPAPEPTRAETQAAALPAEKLDAMAKHLTKYMGPIAPMVVKRESRGSTSLQQLRERLAGMISDDGERAQFLRDSGA